MSTPTSRTVRLLRLLTVVVLALIALVISGLLLADRLTPRAIGEASTHLPVQPAQTQIDRQLAQELAEHPGQSGVLYLSDGLDAYAARALISQQAGRSLDLLYYIWHDDMTGYLLARELYAAAERGVRVRLLLDDMNVAGMDNALAALDAHPNIELRLYNPFRNRSGLWRLVEMVQRAFSVNHRMHNKAWIADGRVAIVGGRNIGEEYFSARPDVNFRDLDLLVAGPVVEQASTIFDDYWNSQAAVPLAKLHKAGRSSVDALTEKTRRAAQMSDAQPFLQRVRERVDRPYSNDRQLHWTANVAVRSDPPLKHQGQNHGDWLVTTLVETIDSAQHKALLISPYFVPGERGTQALSALSARGVQVGVLTNSLAANDVAAVHSGYMRYREPLLRAGVQLHEMKPFGEPERSGLFGSSGASLHTKAFVVDNQRGFVGSFNLDPRSANLNTEMGVLFDDAVLAQRLRTEYLRLAAPSLSYWLYLDSEGQLRWLDWSPNRSQVYTHEPQTSLFKRGSARVISWLPIESQL